MSIDFENYEPRDPWHVCHACATRFDTFEPEHGYLQPHCCPACEAPMRFEYRKDDVRAYFFLYSLCGAPYQHGDDTFEEFRLLRNVRTHADIDAFLDEVRAEAPGLQAELEGRTAEPAKGARENALRAALVRLHAQIESGRLERRLDDMRERASALLRAELEHHQHVFAARRGLPG